MFPSVRPRPYRRHRGRRRSRRGEVRMDDECPIRRLHQEYGGVIVAYATKLTGDRDVAEDLAQETLVRAWRHSDKVFNGQGSVRAWLLTTTKNLVIDRVRAKRVRPVELGEAEVQPDVVAAL